MKGAVVQTFVQIFSPSGRNIIFRLLLWLSMAVCRTEAAPTNEVMAGAGQTNEYRLVLVTNWVQPWGSLRMVSGQLYDVNYSQLWRLVSIPEGATVLNARYDGYVQPIDLTFTWTWQGHRDRDYNYTVVVYNFPYDPAYFRHVEGQPDEIVTAAPMQLHLFPVNIQTNWSPLGGMSIGTETYDYGLAYTNLVPVPSWQRVPVTPMPGTHTVLIPSRYPGMIPPMSPEGPGPASLGGTLSNRLAQAMSITSIAQRDELLTELATSAARDGNVDMVKQSLQKITSETLHDNTAGVAAQILALQGMRRDAIQIAGTITNTRQRLLILQVVTP